MLRPGHRAPTQNLLAFGRRLGFGRNPLRRGPDRVEGFILAVLTAIMILSVPAGLLVAQHAYTDGMRQVAAQRASGHQVDAVLLERAPDTVDAPDAEAASVPGVRVRARWWFNGVERVGYIHATANKPKGAHVRIWLDRSGNQAQAPMGTTNAITTAAIIGLAVPGGVAIALSLVWWPIRRWLDHIRDAAWDNDWAATEPRWNRPLTGDGR